MSIPQSLSFTLLIIGLHADVILWSCVKLFSSEQGECALIVELKQLVTQTADLHEEACILYIYLSVLSTMGNWKPGNWEKCMGRNKTRLLVEQKFPGMTWGLMATLYTN